MPTPEDIEQQQELLVLHRRTLALLLQQEAKVGSAFVLPGVGNSIREARDNIRRIKGILRAWNGEIEDLPDDEAPSPTLDEPQDDVSMLSSRLLSDVLIAPVNRASNAGRLGIALLVLGASLMLITLVRPERDLLSYLVSLLGLILIFVVCVFFYMQGIRPLLDIQQQFVQYKDMIDATQDTAKEMTKLASDLQRLSYRYALQTARTIQVIRPQIRALPLVGKLADSEVITDVEGLSVMIVDYTAKLQQAIDDIKEALNSVNPSGLRKYLTELHGLRMNVESLLKQKQT